MRSALWARLVLPLVAVATGALVLNVWWKADGFFVNLATEFVGIVVTVAYVDWVLRRHEAKRWQGADTRIKERLNIFVPLLITGLRTGLGFGVDILDQSELMSGDPERGHREVLRIATHVLAPATRSRLDTLDQSGWKRLAMHLQTMWGEAERLIDRFGSRLEPAQLELLLDIQQSIQYALNFWQVFPDLAGVPDNALPHSKKTPSALLKASGYDSTAEALRRLFLLAQKLAQQ